MKSEAELNAERRCDIADARMSVAEDMRWLIATLLAALVYVKFDTWLGAIAAYLIPIFGIPFLYNKEYEASHDALERLTNTGKYYVPRQPSEPTE